MGPYGPLCFLLSFQEHKAIGVVVECYLALAKKDRTASGSSVMSAKVLCAHVRYTGYEGQHDFSNALRKVL